MNQHPGWPHVPSGRLQPFNALHTWRLRDTKRPIELVGVVEITFAPERIEGAAVEIAHTFANRAMLILTPEQATWLALDLLSAAAKGDYTHSPTPATDSIKEPES